MRGWRRIRDGVSRLLRIPRRWLGHPDLRSIQRRLQRSESDVEKLLLSIYSDLREDVESREIPAVRQGLEVSRYSQNGEDGLLLHLLSGIGVDRRQIVEIGCGPGHQCNSALLVCGFGWGGILIDRDPLEIEQARNFFEGRQSSHRVTIIEQEVKPDAIDQLLSEQAIDGDLDVLSIDVDGVDFWIWQNLTTIQPRVVVIEVNASFGPERSCSVPWIAGDPQHDRYRHHLRGWHHGASLTAMEALGRSKGYRLVAVDSTGTNAFFLREDLVLPEFPALDPRKAWRPHQVRSRRHSAEEQEQSLRSLPMVEVESDGSTVVATESSRSR